MLYALGLGPDKARTGQSARRNWTRKHGSFILFAMNSEFSKRLERIESLLKTALPEQSNDSWKRLVFSQIDDCINQTHFAGLVEPCAHLVSLGGKRWRPLLLVLCAELAASAKGKNLEAALEKAYTLTPLVEFAHTASLIHDDIEDAADTRRGEPAAHITYGLDTAINAASWLYFAASSCIDSLALPADEKNAFYSLYLLELRRLHLGQAMDILWHRNPQLIPSEAEYRAMVRNKTGTLARLAVKIGMAAGGASPEEIEQAGAIAQDIGVGFQILDDVTNLTSGNPGKKRGDDIVEGKKSLPVLLHLKKNPADSSRLADLFEKARAEGIDSPAVEAAIDLLTKSGAVAEAEAVGNALVEEKSRSLASFFVKKAAGSVAAESLSPAGQANAQPAAAALITELFASMRKKHA